MRADPLRERRVERLRPAAVVPDQVRLPARRLREFRDRPVGRRRPGLEDPQVGGQLGRQRGAGHRRWAEAEPASRVKASKTAATASTTPGASPGGISCCPLSGKDDAAHHGEIDQAEEQQDRELQRA